jgi:phosphoribosylformylglycinamidine cyclo-ligase
MNTTSYRDAGVDIEKGEQLVHRIKQSVEKTYSSAVLSPLGGFAGLYDLSSLLNDYKNPALAQSIDGVGTKTVIANMAKDYSTLGQDLVSATANDILVMGAKPLTLLDYVAASHLQADAVASLVEGLASACQLDNISLVGGETAEMPDVYHTGELDVVGIITGVVDREKIIDGRAVKEGDQIIALPSSGLHTNGFSLARHVFFKKHQIDLERYFEALSCSLAEALLTPHLSYNQAVHSLLANKLPIHGMAHITGGGIINNLVRILPFNTHAQIKKSSIPMPAIFPLIQELGDIAEPEMYQTFNMGAGFLIVVPESALQESLILLNQHNQSGACHVGEIIAKSQGVSLL